MLPAPLHMLPVPVVGYLYHAAASRLQHILKFDKESTCVPNIVDYLDLLGISTFSWLSYLYMFVYAVLVLCKAFHIAQSVIFNMSCE